MRGASSIYVFGGKGAGGPRGIKPHSFAMAYGKTQERIGSARYSGTARCGTDEATPHIGFFEGKRQDSASLREDPSPLGKFRMVRRIQINVAILAPKAHDEPTLFLTPVFPFPDFADQVFRQIVAEPVFELADNRGVELPISSTTRALPLSRFLALVDAPLRHLPSVFGGVVATSGKNQAVGVQQNNADTGTIGRLDGDFDSGDRPQPAAGLCQRAKPGRGRCLSNRRSPAIRRLVSTRMGRDERSRWWRCGTAPFSQASAKPRLRRSGRPSPLWSYVSFARRDRLPRRWRASTTGSLPRRREPRCPSPSRFPKRVCNNRTPP